MRGERIALWPLRIGAEVKPNWYVVCRFTTNYDVGGEVVPWPASLAHAKQVGGSLTACGQNSSTWSRLFHVPFPVEPGENCEACVHVVERS